MNHGETGIVRLVDGCSVSACRPCAPVKAELLVAAFALALNIAPMTPISVAGQSFIQPVRPAGMTVSKRGAVRGKLAERVCRS